jgi:hypothetical protein
LLAGVLVLAASLSQSAPRESVRVHFSTPGNKIQAKLWAKRGADAEYSFVCAAPCKADVPGGTPLRATITDHEDEPYDFVLSNDSGHEVDIIARRGGRGALAGGIVMTSLGGLTALVGVILTAVSFAAINDQQAIRTAGLVCLGIGGGLTVGGVTMIVGRTYEPVVRQLPYENSRWASVPLPTATTPFSLTLTF